MYLFNVFIELLHMSNIMSTCGLLLRVAKEILEIFYYILFITFYNIIICEFCYTNKLAIYYENHRGSLLVKVKCVI